MSKKWASLLALYCYFSCGFCGKVLVWPTKYSHWINLKTILDKLAQRGHEVTVLVSSASILRDPKEQSALKFEVYLHPLLRMNLICFLRNGSRQSKSGVLLGDAFLLVVSCWLNYLTHLWSTVFNLLLSKHMKKSVKGLHYLLPMYLLSHQNLMSK
ncbi:hypothetical protein HPG69_001448 [Diceros bicornis minor]|uniref:UDP-glycosyltransferase n=1 Tax=Diceros bicornis minor TaxID=77932 RepID=A0A7J7FFQ8_DICBM|nr:hypothetical protein HPG69_001448 [Diceros bicornis minor]